MNTIEIDKEASKPGWTKILSVGHVWIARFNDDDVMPFSFTPMRCVVATLGIAAISAAALLMPVDTVTNKLLGLFVTSQDIGKTDGAGSDLETSSNSRPSLPSFGIASDTHATEQQLELDGDIAEALKALAKGDMSPFDQAWPKDNQIKNPSKFTMRKSGDAIFLAIPVAHLTTFAAHDAAGQIAAGVRYMNATDGTFTDAPTPDSKRDRADLWIGAGHMENGKMVFYNLRPSQSKVRIERATNLPDISDRAISKTIAAAFSNNQEQK